MCVHAFGDGFVHVFGCVGVYDVGTEFGDVVVWVFVYVIVYVCWNEFVYECVYVCVCVCECGYTFGNEV